jgi:hypothetical protein
LSRSDWTLRKSAGGHTLKPPKLKDFSKISRNKKDLFSAGPLIKKK